MNWLGSSVSVGMPLMLLLAAASVFSVPVSLAEETCVVKLPIDRCLGDAEECVEKLACEHGRCDPKSGCICDPCWTGKSCNEYVDRFGPTFAERDVFHKISNTPEGLSYTLQVNDEDLGLTCPLGVAGPPARCPCSGVQYRLVSSELGPEVVEVHPETGVVTVTDFTKLDCSRRYRLRIQAQATPPPDAAVRPRRDDMNLTLFCDAKLEADLRRVMQEASDLEAEAEASSALLPPPQNSLEELSRQKRDSAGANPEDTAMDLVRISDTGVTSPKIGAVLEWEFTINLATVSGMDMTVEAFVADLDTGHSVMTITKMNVISFGSGVTSDVSEASTADALAGVSGETFPNANNPDIVDRAVLNLGSLTNTDPVSGGTTDASKIKVAFSAMVVQNTAVSPGSQQYASIGAEYSGSNYVQISQESFTPDSTTTDIPSAVGALSAAVPSINVNQYTASAGEITVPVAVAMGTIQVEAHIAGTDEDALSIGGAWVELGTDYLGSRTFNGDDFRTNQIMSTSGRARRLTSFEFDVAQTGGSSALPADATRAAVLKIPVYATAKAVVGSRGILVVFVRVKDRLTDTWVSDGESTKVTMVVMSGTEPSASGSITLQDQSSVVSDSLSVPIRSVVEYNVVATVSTGAGAFIASETLTLDTSAVTGLRACDVEVISQGMNIIYIESASVTFSPENGETSATLTVTGLHSAILTADNRGNELKFRVAVRADAAGAGQYRMGASNFNLDSVNASGDPLGAVPTVSVSSSAGNQAYIGSNFGMDLTVVYPVNDLSSTSDADFSVEFINDLRTSYEVRMCSVFVVSVGRDLPCARSKLEAGLDITYSYSNTSRANKDVAATSLPLTCASKRDGQTDAQRTIILRAVGQLVPGQTVAESTFNPGGGMVFDDNTLYAGLVGDMTLNGALTAYSGSGDPTITVTNPGTLTYGKVHFVNVAVYVPPGSHTPSMSFTATSSNPSAFRIDRIYLSRVGRNFGCLSTENRLVNLDQLRLENPAAEPDTYPAFSVDSDDVLGSSVTIELGAVSNVGSSSDPGTLNTVETTDVLARDNHILLAVAVQGMTADGVVPSAASFDLTVSGLKDSTGAITPQTESISFSGSSTHYSASDPALSPTFTPRDDSNIYRMIPKIVELSAELPVGFFGTLKVQCSHGASDSSQWEVKGAAPLKHGQNVHGVWVPDLKSAQTTESLGGMELSTQSLLVLPDVTRLETVPTPNATDNQLRVACVALVPGVSDASGSITVQATLLDSADAQIGSPVEATLTLSTSDYTPPSGTPGPSANQTIDLSGNTAPPSGNIGEYFWVPFRLIVPPGVHESELAVVSATDGERAIYTVHAIRYNDSSMGADVLGTPVLTEEVLNLTHTNRNLTHLSQKDTLLVDLGRITNLGLSGELFRGKGSDAEWGLGMEVQLRATDHPLLYSSATATKPMHISFRLDDIIVVESQDVTATVTGSEKIILETELTLKQPEKTKYDKETDQKVGLTVTVRHSNTSTQEAMDAREVIIFPPYMNYTEGEVTFNSSSITVLFKGSSVALVVGEIYFSDIFTVDFNATIDPDYKRGRGTGWANATTLARPICRPTQPTNDYARCGPMTYTMYEVRNPECSDPLVTGLADCRIAVSAAIERGGDYGSAAIKTTGWRPPVRDEPAWTKQYVEFRFGVRTRVSGWKVTNYGARKVTEVKLLASDDGLFFLEKYTGTVTDSMPKDDLGDNSFYAQYVRIAINDADADASNYIQISAELYGCHTDAAPESTCTAVDDNTIYTTETYKWRHFAVDNTNGVIYYCDYDLAKDATLCFASRDDLVWIGQPKYIGELRGQSGGMMYAYDTKKASTLASSDGEHWQVVTGADVPIGYDPVGVVKGTTSTDTTSVTQGDYTGDYYGIKKGGSYLVKWGKCCSN